MITAVCRKNSSADSLIQKTDSDIVIIVKEIETKRLRKNEESLSLRQKVLASDCMAKAKKRIADQMGLHSWLNMDLTPIPVLADGMRKWREREKQRHQLRQSHATVPMKETGVMSTQPPSPFTPSHNDSLNNFSLINATVEMSRLSLLELSTNTPDFLLDTSAHCP